MKYLFISVAFFLVTVNLGAQTKIFDPATLNAQMSAAYTEYKQESEYTEKTNLINGTKLTLQNTAQKYQAKVKDIQRRFDFISIAIDGAKIGIAGDETVKSLKNDISAVYEISKHNPELALNSIKQIDELLKEVEELVTYLIALIATGGTVINKMDNADRQKIVKFVLAEFDTLKGKSRMLRIRLSQLLRIKTINKHKFENFANRDKKLIQEIIKNAQSL